MSEDIWHTTDKNPEEDRLIVVKSKRTGEYLVGSEFEFVLDYFTKWAYFDDLLALETKLERTRNELDIAIDGLKRIEKLTEPSYKNRNLEALALAVNTFSGEIIEQINQRNNND